MKILINDLLQFSDLPEDLKSPGLADRVANTGTLTVNFSIPNDYSTFAIFPGTLSQPGATLSQPGITLSQPMAITGSNEFDCIGIGGTDATVVIINNTIIINSPNGKKFENGLYEIGRSVTANQITISHNGSYMGRIAVGKCHKIPISPSREPGFYSSVTPRRSLSGQVIPTAGGYGGGKIGVDFRYKINAEIIEDFRRAYVTQTMQGYPFFIDFDNTKWLPIQKFYGETDNDLIFQSAINSFKYSKRFEFREAF